MTTMSSVDILASPPKGQKNEKTPEATIIVAGRCFLFLLPTTGIAAKVKQTEGCLGEAAYTKIPRRPHMWPTQQRMLHKGHGIRV